MKLLHFHALRSRNLKLYFFGQGISLTGSWMTTIASSWLMYRLSGSEFYLGLVTFCSQFPSAVCSPFAGVFVDHWDKRRVLVVTQALSLLQSAALAYLAIENIITIDHILALSVFQALINAFDMPARQSLVSELVHERSDLPNAIGLSSAMFHGTRLIGPAIAGFIIAASSEGVCFAVDAVSYAFVLLSLLLINKHNARREQRKNTWRHALVEGVRYVAGHPSIAPVLTQVAIFALFGTAFITLMPAFAHEVFHGGPQLYGYLAASSGLGALVGALHLAARPHSEKSEQFIAKMRILLAVGAMLFAISPNEILGYLALIIVGYAMVSVFAGSNSLLQMVVEDSKRARVMSIYGAAFFGLMPIGGLLSGSVATLIGAPMTVFGGGVICLVVGLNGMRRIRA
jgi:MFS family permease